MAAGSESCSPVNGAGDVASAVDSPVVSWDCSASESPSEHN